MTAAAIDPLAPLTSQQIKGQAVKTITAAYAPAYQSLDQQAKTAQGLYDKRAADDKYYQSWIDSQMATLQSHAGAADMQLTALEQQLTQRQADYYGNQASSLISAADNRAGNVSNNSMSNAFGGELRANEGATMALLGNAAQQALEGVGIRTDELAATRANNYGLIQSIRSKQITDLDTALSKIGQERSLLRSKQTGDIAKEIARLQGIEIQKAQSNRNFAAVSEKLGIAAAETANLIKNRDANTKIAGENAQTNKGRLNLDITKAQQAQMNSDRTYQLDVKRYNHQVAKDLYEQRHGLGWARPGKNGQKAPLPPSSQNAIYNRVTKVRGELESLIGAGYTPAQAWQLLHSGGYVSTPAGANGKPGKKYVGAVGDDGLLNAAYNTRSGGGGLTAGDIKYLESLGLTNPGQRLGTNKGLAGASGNLGGGSLGGSGTY